jgi:hypothetical protein
MLLDNVGAATSSGGGLAVPVGVVPAVISTRRWQAASRVF